MQHLGTNVADACRWIGRADGRCEHYPGEAISAGGVVLGAQVHRNGQRQGGDRHTQRGVVVLQRAAQAGQVGVVDRAAGGFTRGAQIREVDIDRFAARREAAAAQQG